jgi:hypothetical protein
LGRRIEEAAFDLLAALVDARYVKANAKAAALNRGSQALDTPRLLLGMAQDLEHLPTKRCEELSEMFRFSGGLTTAPAQYIVTHRGSNVWWTGGSTRVSSTQG